VKGQNPSHITGRGSRGEGEEAFREHGLRVLARIMAKLHLERTEPQSGISLSKFFGISPFLFSAFGTY